MDWSDDAILLSWRPFSETAAIVMVLTREHGRHAGLVPGGVGKAARAALQPGNRLKVVWKARLAEQLGRLTWELTSASGTVWLDDALRLAGVSAACAMAEAALPERAPHPGAFAGFSALLDAFGEEAWPSLYAHWELGLLREAGYSLDLTRCAVTGATEDLAYVSPRSGRAVSRQAAGPFRDRLLRLPRFLLDRSSGSPRDVADALVLTAYFFERHVLGPHGRGLPPARTRLLDRLLACPTGTPGLE